MIDVTVFDVNVHEAHTVLELEDLVGEPLRRAPVQVGEYSLDQP